MPPRGKTQKIVSPPLAANGNGHRLRQAFIEEIPPKRISYRKSKWQSLYDELEYCLPETPDNCALAAGFDDFKSADSAKGFIVSRYEKLHGLGTLIAKMRPAGGDKWTVYFHRGLVEKKINRKAQWVAALFGKEVTPGCVVSARQFTILPACGSTGRSDRQWERAA